MASRSPSQFSTTRSTACHTPRFCHWRSRRQQVTPLPKPNSGGRSRQRTPRRNKRLFLIDHGASLYFHHGWPADHLERARAPFAAIKDHVLLPSAAELPAADARLAPVLAPDVVRRIVDLVPDEWLGDVPLFPGAAVHRAAYVDYLLARLRPPRAFAEEAARAHAQLV
jgi:hypothetical protein